MFDYEHSFDHVNNSYDSWESFWLQNANFRASREWYITFANRPINLTCKCLECQFINLRWIVLGNKVGHMK